jgi:hypothetical protein
LAIAPSGLIAIMKTTAMPAFANQSFRQQEIKSWGMKYERRRPSCLVMEICIVQKDGHPMMQPTINQLVVVFRWEGYAFSVSRSLCRARLNKGPMLFSGIPTLALISW